jgi:hypothetical protein
MRLIYLTLTLTLCLIHITAISQEWTGSVITDPSISARCDQLIKERQEKIQIKQRLFALIDRNQKLQQITPPNKKKVKILLEENHFRLQKELELSKLKIQTVTEDVIRKGCPGITL